MFPAPKFNFSITKLKSKILLPLFNLLKPIQNYEKKS